MNPKIKNLLKALEKTSRLFWNIAPETGRFINLLIKDRKCKNILEIGTSNGYSSLWIAEALTHTNGHLYTIESHEERYSLAKENFKKSGLTSYVTPILGHAPQDLPKTPEIFDLALFDATKEEHTSYFKALSHHIRKGGIIVTDNVISHKKDLKNYIEAIKKDPSWHSIELNLGSGTMLSYKKH